MTLLYYDERFLDHDTGQHPERPLRLQKIVARLQENGLMEQCRRPTWQPATTQQLEQVHERGHIENVAAYAEHGGGNLDPDTVVSPASFDVARLAAGAACDAVARVVAGEARTALCLVRPPGHHALPKSAMGFCLFNNIALAAEHALRTYDLDRVLIVDWDVHHGNGTQDVFYDRDDVWFYSAHRFPFYPGTGDSDETGTGKGLGATFNLPVKFGTPRKEYLATFETMLNAAADKCKPDLVLISAGFDAHADDPIGSLGLQTEDFAALTTMLRA